MVYRHNGKKFNNSDLPEMKLPNIITRFFCVMAICRKCGKLMRLKELYCNLYNDYSCPDCKGMHFGITRREYKKTDFARLLKNQDVNIIKEGKIEIHVN